ncbi:MAG TPA: hypothetical protein VKE51_18580 [Vicinamibacterales bacterium]|nr:hypothetical protein [Vicinamibacterales bacterium]
MRVTISRLLAATLLALCVGVQALEATGRWDRTFQDSGDEAIVVTVVLCIGAALVVAGATRHTVVLTAVRSRHAVVRRTPLSLFASSAPLSASSTSPPLSLRI